MRKILILITLLFSNSCIADNSYALYNYELKQQKAYHNTEEIRPIASITKLFTAITIINSGINLNELIVVQGGSRGKLKKGSTISRIDAVKAMLISSDNLAAESLMLTYPGGKDNFLFDVNRYILSTGLTHTTIKDSSGLLKENTSTVTDLLRLLDDIKNNVIIRDIASEKRSSVEIFKGNKKSIVILNNTNPSIFKYDNILISKTGFTNPAGRCVVMLIEKYNQMYGIVILGEKNNKSRLVLATNLITK